MSLRIDRFVIWLDIFQGLQKDNADKTEGLFDAESPVYIKAVTWCGGSLAVLTVICLVYELLTRKTRNPNPRRYGKILVLTDRFSEISIRKAYNRLR